MGNKYKEINYLNNKTKSIEWIKYGHTKRVRSLRKKVMRTTPSICMERALLFTEEFDKHKDKPMVLRRAFSFANVLRQMSIYILPGELIVGNQASKPRAAPIFPEFGIEWVERELVNGEPYPLPERPGDKFEVPPGVIEEFEKVALYWRGNTFYDHVMAIIPEETKQACWGLEVISQEYRMIGGDGHLIVDYEKVIREGLRSIIISAEERLSLLQLTNPHDIAKRAFLQAVIIANQAVIDFAKRYAEEAKRLASTEKDNKRKQELLDIYKRCMRVPEKPARNFIEAIQSLWFIQLVLQIEDSGHSVSLGRIDQYLYPYFISDLEAGRMSKEDALEILELLWIKLCEINKLRSWELSNYHRGYPMFQAITIGGQTTAGDYDATNELSYLCLDASAETRLHQPALTARFHKNTHRHFLEYCVQVISLGIGLPALFNDEIIVSSLIRNGISREHALNYAIVGCVEPSVAGVWGYGCNGSTYVNVAKILELAICGGKDPRSGSKLPIEIEGDLSTFSSFDELRGAWRKTLNYFLDQAVILDHCLALNRASIVPRAFVSSLVKDCIKRGKTIEEGGAYYELISGQTIGIPNVVNSLAALKKIVFEDKKVSGEIVLKALLSNFGYSNHNSSTLSNEDNPQFLEEIRQLLLNAPKYGNDEEYVDSIMHEEFKYIAEQWEKYKTALDGCGPLLCRWTMSTSTTSANVPLGHIVGATPDGRLAGTPLAEGVSVFRGTTNSKGPTAVIRSVASIPHIMATGGNVFNLKFSNRDLKTFQKAIIDLLRTYFDLGGWQVQINVIDTEVLKDAKRHPEKYPGLLIRVAGYSAFFTDLIKEVQDDIIARTEYYI